MDSQEIVPIRKKSRSTRTSATQYEELVKYMESHSEFAASKYLTKEGKIHHSQQWDNLAAMLNSLSNGHGKTVKQWQTVWRDLKSNTSKKASKIRNEKNRTGNFPVTTEPLDSLEQRVIGCMGLEYVQGTDCPDSVPEEEELQLQLEYGNEDVLNLPPSTTSIGDILEEPTAKYINIDDNISDVNANELSTNENDLTYMDIVECTNDNYVEPVTDYVEPVNDNYEEPVNNTRNQKGKSVQTTKKRKFGKENIGNSNQRKKPQRIGVQLENARMNFKNIAENHAKAAQLSAEASMMAAENERARIKLEEKRLALEERRLNIDEQHINIIKNLQIFLEKFVGQ